MTCSPTPPSAWLRRAAVCLVAACATAACAGGDTAPDGPPPGDDKAGGPPGELFDTALAQVCRGTGQPRAAAYTTAPGVHPVLVLRSDDGVTFHTGSTTLPDGWRAAYPELERAQLVVCAVRLSATPGRVCDGYADADSGASWSVQLHDARYAYTVRVARTAQVLADTTFDVAAGRCPVLSSVSDGDPSPKPSYPPVAPGAVELFVRPFVTGG